MKRSLSLLLSLLLMLTAISAVSAAPAADAPVMDGKTLVTFGDSLTALSTWPRSVAEGLNMHLVNSGIGGNTTAHAAARFDRDVAAHNPDFVIMCFGTNDFYRADGTNPRVDLTTYTQNLQHFIDRVKALGAEPILMTPPFISPAASGGPSLYPEGSVNYALDKYVDAMRNVAAENGVGLIDMHSVCDNGGYTVESFLIADGVHLSAEGNRVYTDTITAFMKDHYRQDPSAPRVTYPTPPAAEPGVWTKDIAPTTLEDWLIIYPDDAYGIQEADGSLSFANKNGMWPEVHYSPAVEDTLTVPVKGSYLTIDMDFEAGSNIILFFNGPNPTLAYANTYVSLTKHLKNAAPSLQTSGDDILAGQSVYTTLKLEEIIPASFIAADGTVVFSGVKVFVVGDAGKKVTLKELSVTTTDASVTPDTPVTEDADSLLPTDASQITQANGKADAVINRDGSLTLTRLAESDIAWPSVRIASGKTINLSETPYLRLNLTHNGGWANGYLYYTNAYGTQSSVQLSKLIDGTESDFCQADITVNLAQKLGTTGVITLDYYTLSVYGIGGDSVTWHALTTAKDYVEPTRQAGDVNGDGTVSTADATAIFRHILGSVKMDDATLAFGDYDGNGSVSSSDVRRILIDIVSA